MLTVNRLSQFKRDIKRVEKRRKDMAKLRKLILLLIEETPLPSSYRDHSLKGRWAGFRDAHIEPDWLLIYRIVENELHLVRTGSHSDLFKD